MASIFDSYAPYKGDISRRGNGSMISFETGESITYGLFNAQERGTLFIGPGVPVYGGMVIGVNPRSEDMVINVCKKNFRLDDWNAYYKAIAEKAIAEIKKPKYNEGRGQNGFLAGSGL